ncbi:CPBP family intramembrane glutamic endopeptidase [Haloprofundus salinisoli]|uniref:CPBP family intramembrane glutamic endopeptidase n=1 Tax=Haloprofundus salinisoli TaxID=2876193 RepID=UPI001CCEA11C|nr:type II CAAX endopeptidase family protein [Haloprofundus salinisoli]
MADWSTFAGFAGVVLVLLLLLARASQGVVSGGATTTPAETTDTVESIDAPETATTVDAGETTVGETVVDETTVGESAEISGLAGTDSNGTTAPSAPERPNRLEDVEFPGRVKYGPAPERRPAGETAPVNESEGDAGTDPVASSADRLASGDLSTGALLANVALSQGLFAGLLLAGAWVAEIPASAFGVTAATTDLTALALGVAFGVVLYVVNEIAAIVGERFDLGGVRKSQSDSRADRNASRSGDAEALREALAPDSAGGWAVLLLIVLPIIAGFEELLFRGALVGVLSAGFGISPWLLAALSSVAFGLGHGAQGPVGILVTGAVGFVLAAAFVLTESLLVVVVAHYLVNALEFVVHEGFGWEWTGRERTS